LIERLEEHYKSLEAAVAAEPADHVKFQDTGLDLPVAALSLQSKIAKPNLKTAESLKTPSIVKPLIPIVPKKTLIKERTAEPTKSEPEIGAKPKKVLIFNSVRFTRKFKAAINLQAACW
jgi:hypothetical protein